MKKILILGKTSFVGASFKEYLEEKFSEDYILEVANSRNNEWQKYDFGKYDAVFNVAGRAHVRAKKSMKDEYYVVNRDMPIAMGKKAKAEGCKLFIHMSSEIVYGGMSRIGIPNVITKETIPKPINFYGDSKLQADLELEKLVDENFHVALIRPPLMYSENVKDGNFPLLIKMSRIIPIFPTLENRQSMLYVYNLTELVRLIIENWGNGYYYPQNREYASTSKMVKDFADGFGHKIYMIGIFNPILKVLSRYSGFVTRAFGEMVYDMDMSGHFEWKYCVYSYEESIKNTVAQIKAKELLR